ncbi:hypothetical protein [uncultured Brevundimonas sp.]|uniref:hypothetical protein n=1 Tax=uncultured Brevundimonas sp. TaxID=213418 RepID=UPI0025E5BEB4|nr:hypothetical protein [uncultured Brevundimonas sp.]
MTDVTYHRSRYDAPKKKGFMGVPTPVLLVCLLVVTILFALLIFFLQQSKFKLKEFNYVDESVEVELVEPVLRHRRRRISRRRRSFRCACRRRFPTSSRLRR